MKEPALLLFLVIYLCLGSYNIHLVLLLFPTQKCGVGLCNTFVLSSLFWEFPHPWALHYTQIFISGISCHHPIGPVQSPAAPPVLLCGRQYSVGHGMLASIGYLWHPYFVFRWPYRLYNVAHAIIDNFPRWGRLEKNMLVACSF